MGDDRRHRDDGLEVARLHVAAIARQLSAYFHGLRAAGENRDAQPRFHQLGNRLGQLHLLDPRGVGVQVNDSTLGDHFHRVADLTSGFRAVYEQMAKLKDAATGDLLLDKETAVEPPRFDFRDLLPTTP